jgi:hypothetical protein
MHTLAAILQCVLNGHRLSNALLDLLPLFLAQPLQRSPREAAIAVLELDSRLSASNGRLCEHPVALAENLLQLDGFFVLALSAKVPDFDAELGKNVGTASNDTATAGCCSLYGEVCNTSVGHPAAAL